MTEKQENLSRILAVINHRNALLKKTNARAIALIELHLMSCDALKVVRLLLADIAVDIRAIFDFIREWFAYRLLIIEVNSMTDEEFEREHSRHFPVSPESLGVTPDTQAEGEA
jgi:hypothetical protein